MSILIIDPSEADQAQLNLSGGLVVQDVLAVQPGIGIRPQ
jgi:hypothetical protein